MSLEQNDVNQAIICYKKAIEADVKCAKYHWQRCSLLEQVSEKTKALLGYKRLLNVLDPDQASVCMDYGTLVPLISAFFRQQQNVH